MNSKTQRTYLVASTLLAASTTSIAMSEAQSPAATTTASSTPKPLASVDRCVAQEKLGDACACWLYLKEKAPPKGTAELALTEMKASACAAKAKEPAPTRAVSVSFPKRKVEDGTCYMGATMKGAPSEILSELTDKCVAPTGMLPMTPVITGYQRKEDKPELYRVVLSDKECYRFFAIGDSTIENIVAKVLDPELKEMAVDLDVDRVKVLAPKKAICPKTSGLHAVWVSVAAGQGRYVLQGFRRPADSPPPAGENADPKHQALLDTSSGDQAKTSVPSPQLISIR